MAVKSCSVHRLVADVAVLSDGHVLMVKYRNMSKYDNQSGWFLPDDYLVHLEHPDDAAKRIITEQAGLNLPDLRLDHVESFGNGAWHLVFHYKASLGSRPAVRAAGNVLAIAWFPLDKLPDESEVAHHGWGLDVLRTILSGRRGG